MFLLEPSLLKKVEKKNFKSLTKLLKFIVCHVMDVSYPFTCKNWPFEFEVRDWNDYTCLTDGDDETCKM